MLNAIIIIITQYHLKRVVRDDPEFSDFWQRFDETDGELDTEKVETKILMQNNSDSETMLMIVTLDAKIDTDTASCDIKAYAFA